MPEVSVIVISSPLPRCGKTTLAINLGAALWSDGYQVELFAPNNALVDDFSERRRQLIERENLNLYMPKIVNRLPLHAENPKHIVIADIPSINAQQYMEVFNQAHTLITVVNTTSEADWTAENSYLNLIWNAKKHIAARGVKTANWVVVPYVKELTTDSEVSLEKAARRFGFRVAEKMPYREAYNHISEGYCAADMKQNSGFFNMSFADVYARREILRLADFLWK